jgi:hypothetical protein
MGWMDRLNAASVAGKRFPERSQSSGERLKVVAAKRGTLILDTDYALGPSDRYVGKVSPDGSEMRGA